MPTLTQPSFRLRSNTPYGMTLPSCSSTKSWITTSSGSPLGCHSRPPFLNGPTSSFFLVSTDINGSVEHFQQRGQPVIYSNCALRSGCEPPSLVLRLLCRL